MPENLEQLLENYFQHVRTSKNEIQKKKQEIKQSSNALDSGISFFDSLLTVIIIAKFGLQNFYELQENNSKYASQFFTIVFTRPILIETFIMIEDFLRQIYNVLNPPKPNQGFIRFDTIYDLVMNRLISDEQKQNNYKSMLNLYKTARNCMHNSFMYNGKNTKFCYKGHHLLFNHGEKLGVDLNDFLKFFIIDIVDMFKEIILSDEYIKLNLDRVIIEQQIAPKQPDDFLFFTHP